MPLVQFTLQPLSASRLHDALVCLARFNDFVHIEARRDRLLMTALNLSKSAYASFSLGKGAFFSSYNFDPGRTAGEERFGCSILNKALLSVFTNRLLDSRGKESAIDRCEVTVEDGPGHVESKFVIRMICGHGITKTYRLNYESVEVMHALFDRNSARNGWSVHSSRLKSIIDHFGPKTEQLDIFAGQGRFTFTSFTGKVMDGNEILKHPLQTSVTISTADFDRFDVQQDVHVVINVRDFKAIVAHACVFDVALSSMYSQPTRPLQLWYEKDGMRCEFTLMTSGDAKLSGQTTAAKSAPPREQNRANAAPSVSAVERNKNTAMPPPGRMASRRTRQPGSAKPLPPTPRDNESFESLFVPAEQDERQWDPPPDEEEETLGWDASADHDAGIPSLLRGSTSVSQSASHEIPDGFAPTQQISQIKGIFD